MIIEQMLRKKNRALLNPGRGVDSARFRLACQPKLTRKAFITEGLLSNNRQFNSLDHFRVQLNVDVVLTNFADYTLWQANF